MFGIMGISGAPPCIGAAFFKPEQSEQPEQPEQPEQSEQSEQSEQFLRFARAAFAFSGLPQYATVHTLPRSSLNSVCASIAVFRPSCPHLRADKSHIKQNVLFCQAKKYLYIVFFYGKQARMQLEMSLPAIPHGMQTRIAHELGCSQAAVWKWWDTGIVPAERVLGVERITGISRHVIRPDIYPPESPPALADLPAPDHADPPGAGAADGAKEAA
jgi:hypothetical protein